jgi:hypothetical protein
VVHCSQCGKAFEQESGKAWETSICGSIMGDEYIETYFFCVACGVYTVEVYHDRFLGEESVQLCGPLPKADGDAAVALINRCSEPWNKKCRCEAHRSYFGPSLD